MIAFHEWRRTHPPMMGGAGDVAEAPAEAAPAGAGGDAVVQGEEKGKDGIERLLTGFEEFKGTVTSRIAAIEEALQPEPEPEPEPQFPEPQFAPQDFDTQGQLTKEAANRELQRLVDARVDEKLRPRDEAARTERLNVEAAALEERYPALKDPEQQEEWIKKSIEQARLIGRPELGVEPGFLEMVYLAATGREKAEQETPAGSDREVPLEGAGGAAAGSADAEDDTADRIANLAKKRRLFE